MLLLLSVDKKRFVAKLFAVIGKEVAIALLSSHRFRDDDKLPDR